MDIQSSGASGASLELASLKLAKNQQEQEGQAALQLIEEADVPKPSTAGSIGANIDTFA